MDIDDKLPLVSVIIASYNHEKYIESAIRSVWEQTYKNIELIILDDGSTDQSPSIINALEKISPIKTTVVLKKNEGLCKTLNKGVALAQGKYISFLASDDKFLPNKFEDIIPVFESDTTGLGMIFSNGFLINTNSVRIGKISKDYQYKSGDIYEDLLLWRFMIQYSTVVFPLSVLKEIGGFNENYAFEDWDVFLKISKKYSCLYVDKYVSEYRVGAAGSLSQNVAKLVPSILGVFEENIVSYHKGNNMLWRRMAYSVIYLRIGQCFYIVRDFYNARPWLVKSIFFHPFQFKSYNLLVRTFAGKKIINKISKIKNDSKNIFRSAD